MHVSQLLLTDLSPYIDAHYVSGPIRAQTAIDWATGGSAARGPGGQGGSFKPGPWLFLPSLRASFPETEVPDHRLLAGSRRPRPFLFTVSETSSLGNHLDDGPRHSLRPCCGRLDRFSKFEVADF